MRKKRNLISSISVGVPVSYRALDRVASLTARAVQRSNCCKRFVKNDIPPAHVTTPRRCQKHCPPLSVVRPRGHRSEPMDVAGNNARSRRVAHVRAPPRQRKNTSCRGRHRWRVRWGERKGSLGKGVCHPKQVASVAGARRGCCCFQSPPQPSPSEKHIAEHRKIKGRSTRPREEQRWSKTTQNGTG